MSRYDDGWRAGYNEGLSDWPQRHPQPWDSDYAQGYSHGWHAGNVRKHELLGQPAPVDTMSGR